MRQLTPAYLLGEAVATGKDGALREYLNACSVKEIYAFTRALDTPEFLADYEDGFLEAYEVGRVLAKAWKSFGPSLDRGAQREAADQRRRILLSVAFDAIRRSLGPKAMLEAMYRRNASFPNPFSPALVDDIALWAAEQAARETHAARSAR